MKKKIIIGVCAAALAVIAGLVIWKVTAKKDKAPDDTVVLYADSVGMLTGTGLGTSNRFAGIVEAQNTLKIPLESGQTVKEIFVEKGQSVEAGTPLFQYDTEDMSMKLEQANLELEKISNNITSLSAQVDEMIKEKKQAPESEQLSWTTQIQEVQMSIKQEEYNHKVKELEIDQLKKSLDSSLVTSTIAGIVQEINETPSFDNFTGEQLPFMSILAVGKYRVKGTVSEQNMMDIYPGLPVIVHSRVDENLIWSGVIDTIDTEKPITDNSGMYIGGSDGSSMQATKYPFYVTLDSSDGLMLGQHVYLEPNLGQGTEKDGMWLMSPYIVQEEGSAYVWAAGPEDKLEKRELSLGAHDEETDTWEILDGLKSSDYIVWPSEDCKAGASVMKNDAASIMPETGGVNGEISNIGGADSAEVEVLPEDLPMEEAPAGPAPRIAETEGTP